MATEVPNTPENVATLQAAMTGASETIAALQQPSGHREILHVRTEIKATFAVPDGHGNAVERTVEVTVPQLTDERWAQALTALRKMRMDAQAQLVAGSVQQQQGK